MKKNAYKSVKAIQFMMESLHDLQAQFQKKRARLFLFHGISEKVIAKMISSQKINAVFLNKDYTPFSVRRDQLIERDCKKRSVDFCAYDDALLQPPNSALKSDKSPFHIFTPFYRHLKKIPVNVPIKNIYNNYYVQSISNAVDQTVFHKILPYQSMHSTQKGGRTVCLQILKNLKKNTHYTNDRDFPYKNATTGLSPHLKFTTCSVREMYHAIKKNMPNPTSCLRQLYWRDFFTLIAYHYPHVFGHAYHRKYDHLKWNNNKRLFKAWCLGQTGFPIVDAGMRELRQTGSMHNRVRLITASFLVKDLHIDWRWGEKYFAQHLVDYDPSINNGNWQWVASTGSDAQPYFRIFNPWLQQRKFDKDCQYIKKWIPELKQLRPQYIHRWYNSKYHSLAQYAPPVVDHDTEALKTKKWYKTAQTQT